MRFSTYLQRLEGTSFLKYVDARSMKNMRRIIDPDPETTLQGDKLMDIFREMEGDSERTKEFLLVCVSWMRRVFSLIS